MYIWCVRPGLSGTRRWAASHCLFAKLGPRRGCFRANTSSTPWLGALTVHSGEYLARGDPSRAGRGGGLPRIAYSRSWAVDAAIFVPAPRISSVLAHSPSKAALTWRVRTHAEWGPAMDSFTLRIRVIGPSTRRYHNDASKIPSFDTFTLESDVLLVRETGAERDTALGCLALRIREIGPSARRFSCQHVEYSLVWRTHRP
jgi:hypothetical protein